MERTIIYRTQRTVTDVRTKGGMKAHICVYGEIARAKGKGFFLDFQAARQIHTQNLANGVHGDRERDLRAP